MVMAAAASGGVNGGASASGGGRIPFASALWFANAGISCALCFSKVSCRGLSSAFCRWAVWSSRPCSSAAQQPRSGRQPPFSLLLRKKYQVLVTLLLCNAAVMEVIPQAICTRYGLAVGAKFVRLVRILMIICYPLPYPIGKILDCALGHADLSLFRRAQFKTLVSIHSKEADNGGDLTHVETTMISGVLDMTEKCQFCMRFLCSIKFVSHLYLFTAEEAMTSIESTFSLDVNSKFDWDAFSKILTRGHSRIPVYSGNPKNIIGFLLVGVDHLLLILLFLVLFSRRYA